MTVGKVRIINIIGLVTARSSSKCIPRKNIKLLAGKPLIAWTIEAARQSRLTRIVVSTDDEEIAGIARQWGADTPFLRPPELARDDSSSIAVIIHAIEWMQANERIAPDYLMLLQPTSPFRIPRDIDAAIELAEARHATAVVSVCEAQRHPHLCKRILSDGTLADFVASNLAYQRRQDLPPAYALNGAIYLNRRESLIRDRTFLPGGTLACVMPAERSLDIDTPWDWRVAELILKDRNEHA